MSANPLNQLAALGQSFWYDNIRRSLLTEGELARMIAEDSLTGVTSNPAIFNRAISQSSDYDKDLIEILAQNQHLMPVDVYERLAIRDIQTAADLLRPVYERTNGVDGYVSLEVSPTLAYHTAASITEGQRLFKAVGRPNVMIKIPGTPEGVPAIKALIGEGINVNVTLLFSLQHYEAIVQAYIEGLELLAAAGRDISRVASVASFFVSRVDGVFDAALQKMGTESALKLLGKVGIANAKAAYQRFEAIFGSGRFKALEAKGAHVQRPLWASTGNKNPAYRDVMYVEALIGPHTVNTMPPDTVTAFKDHGVAGAYLKQDVESALAIMAQVESLGLNYTVLTNTLQLNGVTAFVEAFHELLGNLEAKQIAILPQLK